MKKKICLLLCLLLCATNIMACGKEELSGKEKLENDLLGKHEWGETENEAKGKKNLSSVLGLEVSDVEFDTSDKGLNRIKYIYTDGLYNKCDYSDFYHARNSVEDREILDSVESKTYETVDSIEEQYNDIVKQLTETLGEPQETEGGSADFIIFPGETDTIPALAVRNVWYDGSVRYSCYASVCINQEVDFEAEEVYFEIASEIEIDISNDKYQ